MDFALLVLLDHSDLKAYGLNGRGVPHECDGLAGIAMCHRECILLSIAPPIFYRIQSCFFSINVLASRKKLRIS